jgi:hypothetical protein
MTDNHIRHFTGILPLRESETDKDPIPEESIDLEAIDMTEGELSEAMMFLEFRTLKENDLLMTRELARLGSKLDEILKLALKNGDLLSQILTPKP